MRVDRGTLEAHRVILDRPITQKMLYDNVKVRNRAAHGSVTPRLFQVS